MGVRIEWAPGTETGLASYDLLKGAAPDGAFVAIVTIPYDLTGVNYDAARGVFFYVDAAGTASDYYEIVARDTSGNASAPSPPFHAAGVPPTVSSTMMVDQDYGAPGALRYQDAAGAPLEGASIRVFRKTDFDLGNTAVALAVTQTDAAGNFVDPIFLTAGFTYVVQFFKEGISGPDHTEIVV